MPATSVSTATADAPVRGIAYALVGVLVFSIQDAMAKWLTADYAVMEILFFRGLFALIPCALIVSRTGGRASLRTRRLGHHLGRAALLMGALVCYYLAIRSMPLADAVAISFSAPLFMTALSVPLLGEHVGARRWAAVVVGFVGVLIVARPGSGAFDAAALLVVAASLFYAGAMIATRSLNRSESSGAIMFYFTLTSIVASAGFVPFQWVTPTPADAALLAALGLIGGFGAFFVVESFRHAPVAVIAPFDYSGLVWAALFGFVLWGDVPGPAVLTGAAVIVASNLYIIRREARGSIAAPPPPPRPA